MFPVAIATGCIHIGTMIGKLNGVIPAHTPSGWRKRVQVDVGRDLVGELALGQLRDPARELDDLHAADDLALGVLERLAVLGRDDPRELVGARVDQLAEREHDARERLTTDVSLQVANAVLAACTAASTSAASASSTCRCSWPVAGSNTGAVRVEAPAVSWPPMHVVDLFELDGAHGVLTVVFGFFRYVFCVALSRSYCSRAARVDLERRHLGHRHVPPGLGVGRGDHRVGVDLHDGRDVGARPPRAAPPRTPRSCACRSRARRG